MLFVGGLFCVKDDFFVSELELDLESSLYKEPLIAKELEFRLDNDPGYLDWWGGEPANEFIFNALKESTIANDYGEFDNYDFIVKSAWSKQKGIGKSSVAVALKLFYDEVVTENGFDLSEVFFTISDKIEYLKKNAGKLKTRFFVLDEMVPLIGQSSTADTMRMLRLDDTSRINGYCNAYVSPRGEAWFSHDYYIEVVLKDVDHKTIVCCLRARNGVPLGWLGFPRPRYSVWQKYQKKKRGFLKRLESGEVREMHFRSVYEKLEEMFEVEEKFRKQLLYYDDLSRWTEGGKKGAKPVKPFVAITPGRIRNWLVAVNPEMTNQELDTGAEVVFSLLEKKFKGGVC
jgi:hypothetical protein